MIDLFSTREIAIGIIILFLLLIILVLCICSRNTRCYATDFLKALSNKKVVLTFIIIIVYTSIWIIIFSYLPFYNNLFIKDIVVWLIVFGVSECVRAVSAKYNDHYFKEVLKDVFSMIIPVQFIISKFTLSIWLEITLQIIIILSIIYYGLVVNRNRTTKKNNIILLLIGSSFLAYSLYKLYTTFDSINWATNLIEFLIPVVFSIIFLPLSYGFAVYSRYEINLLRMKKFVDNKNEYDLLKCKLIRKCGLSFKKISAFEEIYSKKLHHM